MSHESRERIRSANTSPGRVNHDLNAFKYASHLDSRIDIADGLAGIPSELAQNNAGYMYLDLANDFTANPEQAIDFLVRARTAWEQTLAIHDISSDILSYDAQYAAMGLACLPLNAALIVGGRLPAFGEIQHAYDRLIDTGLTAATAQVKLHSQKSESAKSANNDLKGGNAEIVVLLLLQRFALRELKDNSWVANLSLFRENRARKRHGSYEHGSWDVSVFTARNADMPPNLGYKVQVKSSNHKHSDQSYSPDITVVSIEDLFPPYKHPRINGIIKKCEEERQGSALATSYLDEKTEKLLAILD